MRPGVPWGTCSPNGDTGYDGISPDHFVINVASGGGTTPAEPDGLDVVTVWFDVTGSLGQFEFDTACFRIDLGTIYMIDNAFPPDDHGPTGTGEATFGKGIITIAIPHDPPTIYCPQDTIIFFGDPLNLTVTATDDGLPTTPLSMTAKHFPDWVNFSDNGNNTGTLTGTPVFGDDGQNTGFFIADDGDLADTCYVTITVFVYNDRPTIECTDDITIYVGDPLNLTVTATDDDEPYSPMTMSAEDVPGWGNFNDNQDNSGTLTGTPQCADLGQFTVRFIASDGRLEDTCFVTITVEEGDCLEKGDVNDGGGADPLDVTCLVNYVYLGRLDALAEQRPDCPFPAGDMDCARGTNPVDVAYLANYVYKGLDALCDGCSH
jgi:hypothetical protein